MDVAMRSRRGACAVRTLLFLGLAIAGPLAAEENPPTLAIQPGKGGASAKDKEKQRDELVTAKAYLSTDKLPAGRTCKVVVLLDIREGWHINQNPAEPEFVVPTKFSLKSKLRSSLSNVAYPPGEPFTVSGMKEPQMVYQNQVAIHGVITVPKEAAGKTEEMELIVKYQACNDRECRAPTELKLGGKVPVAGPGETVKEINQNLFPKNQR
jgi:hypothetical protein